jgi:hypothetical protein
LPDDSPKVRRRVDRIHAWLDEEPPRLHALLTALDDDSRSDPKCRIAYVLVAECATRILDAFAEVCDARDLYISVLGSSSKGDT